MLIDTDTESFNEFSLPHASYWDASLIFLAKWAVGVEVMFWGKDSLFRIPLLGIWLRWIGGVAVQRTAPGGKVGQAIRILVQHKQQGSYFWLGLAPEGTRKYIPSWRSGFYQAAQSAQVPLCLIKLDYGKREIKITDFVRTTGDAVTDMARIALIYQGVCGLVPSNAAPIVLLDPAVPRTDTVVHSLYRFQ